MAYSFRGFFSVPKQPCDVCPSRVTFRASTVAFGPEGAPLQPLPKRCRRSTVFSVACGAIEEKSKGKNQKAKESRNGSVSMRGTVGDSRQGRRPQAGSEGVLISVFTLSAPRSGRFAMTVSPHSQTALLGAENHVRGCLESYLRGTSSQCRPYSP